LLIYVPELFLKLIWRKYYDLGSTFSRPTLYLPRG